MSASWNCTAWNFEIGRPNWCRCCAYANARSYAPCARPTPIDATEIEAGRALVYRAAWLKDQGRPFALAAAQAKLYTGELSNRVVNAALQIHGGYGFMEEFAISRLYRDQKILEIGEGTNEVQRMVIAKQLGL